MAKPWAIEQIGSETLTTTKKTLTGAINELDKDIVLLDSRSIVPRGNAISIFGTADFNSFTKQGSYIVVDVITNRPPGCLYWGTLLVYEGGTGAIIQEFTEEITSRKWYRHFAGSVWRDWMEVSTTDVPTFTHVRGVSNDGGRILLAKPSVPNNLDEKIAIDCHGNALRAFENGGQYRGFHIDLVSCKKGASTKIATSENSVMYNHVNNGQKLQELSEAGIYRGSFDLSQLPPEMAVDGQGVVEITPYNSGWAEYTWRSAHYMHREFTQRKANGVFEGWYERAIVKSIPLAPHLQSGWIDYGYGYNPPRATKIGNLVTLHGILKQGAITFGSSLMQLPAEFRPQGKVLCYVFMNNKTFRVEVHPNGTVPLQEALPGNGVLSLESITFSVI